MTKFVITPEVALRLAHDHATIAARHRLLAPTLLRSQVLSQLFRKVAGGELTRRDAVRQLDYIRKLSIRLLGDRALQETAWKIAAQLGWPDTLAAEYVALTVLQADALVTLDTKLAGELTGMVTVAPMTDLLEGLQDRPSAAATKAAPGRSKKAAT